MTKEKYDVELNNMFQIFGDNYVLFPFEYLCAKSLMDGKIYKTENTYTIHHFSGSWLSTSQKMKNQIKRIMNRIIGEEITAKICRYIKKKL